MYNNNQCIFCTFICFFLWWFYFSANVKLNVKRQILEFAMPPFFDKRYNLICSWHIYLLSKVKITQLYVYTLICVHISFWTLILCINTCSQRCFLFTLKITIDDQVSKTFWIYSFKTKKHGVTWRICWNTYGRTINVFLTLKILLYAIGGQLPKKNYTFSMEKYNCACMTYIWMGRFFLFI